MPTKNDATSTANSSVAIARCARKSASGWLVRPYDTSRHHSAYRSQGSVSNGNSRKVTRATQNTRRLALRPCSRAAIRASTPHRTITQAKRPVTTSPHSSNQWLPVV
jgi:hypothetical protein